MASDAVADLHREFLAAFRPYLLAQLAELGVEEEAAAAAIEAGESLLEADLAALLAEPFARQTRSPLEVLRAAVAPVTAALSAAGIPALERDPGSVAAAPGDRYGLEPLSSRVLGESAWRAHLAWGVAKARSLARPVVGLLSQDLMDRTRIEEVVSGAGFLLEAWQGAEAVLAGFSRPPVVAFVDLAHTDADGVIRLLAEQGTRVIGYGPHVDDFAMTRARSLGAADAVARSVLFRSLREHLPTLV